MRLGMCSTSGQLVSTASATPASDHPDELRARRAAARAPSAAGAGRRSPRRRRRCAPALAERGLAPVRRRRGARDWGGSGRRARGAGDPGAHRLLVFATAGIGAAYGSRPPDNSPAPRDRPVRRSGASAALPLCQSARRICVTLSAMKVLVVGAGGVGAAFAAIAQRRPAFEQVVLADVAPERVKAVVAGLGEPDRFSAERVDASSKRRPRRADRARAARRRAQRLRPALQRADLQRRVRGARDLPRHGDDALAPASRSARTSCRARCSASTSSRATRRGSRPACWRSSASASSRACPTCSPLRRRGAVLERRRSRRARRRRPGRRGL